MAQKSSILRKGLVVIAIPILFQILFAGLLLIRQRRVEEAGRWAIHTKVVIADAETMFRTLVEADGAARAFAATGDASFNQTAGQAFTRIRESFDELFHQVIDNPPQVARLNSLREEVDQFIDEREKLRQVASGADHDATQAMLRTVVRTPKVAQLRMRIDDFLSVEQGLDQRRVAEFRRLEIQQYWVLAAGAVAVLVVGLASSTVFTRSIVRRLSTLNANVHRLSAGESLVPRVGGHDEISALDASFHGMAEQLAVAALKEKNSQEHLERRALELAETNRELKEKSDENEMFVYSVSHDLRSPLVNLQGFSNELKLALKDLKEMFLSGKVPADVREDVSEILDHGMAEPVHFIQSAVTRLSTIIDALLRLSRAGRVEYQRIRVDVETIVTRVSDSMQAIASQKGAKIVAPVHLPAVMADPAATEQIFANLIGNALNYLDPARSGEIELSAVQATPEMVTFRVQDNGLGIPAAYVSKIFSIFQRLHGNVAPGEGIGLALVRRMVERQGGRVWVESVEGKGSSFFVSLPSDSADETAGAAA